MRLIVRTEDLGILHGEYPCEAERWVESAFSPGELSAGLLLTLSQNARKKWGNLGWIVLARNERKAGPPARGESLVFYFDKMESCQYAIINLHG